MDKDVGKLVTVSDAGAGPPFVLRILRKDRQGYYVKHAGQRVPAFKQTDTEIYWAPLKDAAKQRKKIKMAREEDN